MLAREIMCSVRGIAVEEIGLLSCKYAFPVGGFDIFLEEFVWVRIITFFFEICSLRLVV